jgi:Adenylyl/Guanylyl and SMODS C-terminal sensor domain
MCQRGRVRKNRNIRFVATTNVPGPHDLYWKIRNGGKEAADANQLRGEITKTQGYTKNEPTAFAGYHYVEVYVVKNGIVVARDRQGVVVTTK